MIEVSKNKSTLSVFKDDLGKNVYRKKFIYTLTIEQDVIANNIDEAEEKFCNSGVEYSELTSNITHEYDGVETQFVDAEYEEGITSYLGKVVYEDTEDAKEYGDVEIDTYAPEVDIPDEVDTMLNIENEMKVGK